MAPIGCGKTTCCSNKTMATLSSSLACRCDEGNSSSQMVRICPNTSVAAVLLQNSADVEIDIKAWRMDQRAFRLRSVRHSLRVAFRTSAPTITKHLRLSMPLHRPPTPRVMHSVRVHHPQREPRAMAIGATDLAGWHLRTESIIVRVLHVRHAPPSPQARPPRPRSGCRCRCIARPRPGPCTQLVSTTLEESRLRWPSVQPIWLAATCGPKA